MLESVFSYGKLKKSALLVDKHRNLLGNKSTLDIYEGVVKAREPAGYQKFLPVEPVDLKGKLYNVRAMCKQEIATIAMHLDQKWRKGFFQQLDILFDVEEWDHEDELVTRQSFLTLMRLLLFIEPSRRPGIGASSDGHMIAAWTNGKNRLTIECLPDDEVRWVVINYVDDERESAAGKAPIGRMKVLLEPYKPEQWFEYDR